MRLRRLPTQLTNRRSSIRYSAKENQLGIVGRMRAFNDATVDLDDRTFSALRRAVGSGAHTAEQEAS
jgi:hypothetical protein